MSELTLEGIDTPTPSQLTALEERSDWRTTVVWRDAYGMYHAVTTDGPGAHRRARRALWERFHDSDRWGVGYRPALHTVEARPHARGTVVLRHYVERVA